MEFNQTNNNAGDVNNGPVLESVDAYNARIRKERQAIQKQMSRTGVACPKCGGELEWVREYRFISYPAQPRPAQCLPCKLTVELER